MNFIKSNVKRVIDDNLKRGAHDDALGKAYEKSLIEIFNCQQYVDNFNNGHRSSELDEVVFRLVCESASISKISSCNVNLVPKRFSGGEPKTDVCVVINDKQIKISSKKSKSKAVSAAEFDAETIFREVKDLKNIEVRHLIDKFIKDSSAKNFSSIEKGKLERELKRFDCSRKLVKWVLSGSPEDFCEDPRIADTLVTFSTDSEGNPTGLEVCSINNKVNKLLSRKGGFGTGLSWTYATGTKGKKLQFKVPVTTIPLEKICEPTR
jgi:hypothetical protein